MQQLPAGLTNNQVEFFTEDAVTAHALCRGQALTAELFSPDLLDKLDSEFDQYPDKRAGVRAMGAQGRVAEIAQLLICLYGGFDTRPDMINGKLQPFEFWLCPKRQHCSFKGKVCIRLKTDTGEYLSDREIEIVQLSAAGYLDKAIAGELNIKLNTVTTHQRTIRRKTNLYRKADITRFAHQNNLV